MTKQTLNKSIEKLAEIKNTTKSAIMKDLQNKDQWTWYLIEEVAKSL